MIKVRWLGRGAPVLAFTRIDDKKITDRSEFSEHDYLVVMDEILLDENAIRGLSSNGFVILNSPSDKYINKDFKGRKFITIDVTTLALEILGFPITNTAMFGTLVAASGVVSLASALNSIDAEMKPAITAKNKNSTFKINRKLKKPELLREHLLKQGRFKHLTDKDIEMIETDRDKRWE